MAIGSRRRPPRSPRTAALTDPKQQIEGDPLVPLAIAEGKIEGYAARLGARVCEAVPTVTMPP